MRKVAQTATFRHIFAMIAVGITCLVLLWPRLPAIEGYFFPVVGNVQTFDQSEWVNGVTFWVALRKGRNCEFLGHEWSSNGVRLVLDYREGSRDIPESVETGSYFFGPWFLWNAERLEGTESVVVHRCHPLWKTKTHFYP